MLPHHGKSGGNYDDVFQADVLYELARVYFYYGSFEGALKLLSNIMMEVPLYKQMNEVMLLNASCLWRLELYDESIKYWEHILDNLPDPYTERDVIFMWKNAPKTRQIARCQYVIF